MTSYGKNITVRIFGGSHDAEIGITVEGLPAGIPINMDSLLRFMARRAPGQNKFSTSRSEPDHPIFTSGVDENMTTDGTTLRAIIKNTNVRSGDYSNLVDVPRPSHADYAAIVKSNGKVDLRGGGHFSGRLTAPLCILGGILIDELKRRGITIGAHIASICGVSDKPYDPVNVTPYELTEVSSRPFSVIDIEAGERMKERIEEARMDCDSVGGIIECAVLGLPIGLGEHIFSGMESRIASLAFSVPAIKGIEFGAGFKSSEFTGYQNNDPFITDGTTIKTKTNNCGGILGGMTNGMPLIFRAAVKPTPSISKVQDSVNLQTMENTKLQIHGRHDPCIVPRAIPVFEAVAAIAVFDAMLDDQAEEIEK